MRLDEVRVSIRAVAVIALLASSRAGAQCPDGSPGACQRPAPSATRTVPIDRNRVAVLPFRVATADTLLGEGFAELLAREFTGEGGPRAVDMSTTLSTWRRAGGGLRTPLPQDSAMRLARGLGAGILLEGGIVGLSGRLSISASMVNSSTGAPIGQPANAAGPKDSVEALLRQVAATLLGAGASDRVLKSARLSKSPAALRSYLEGLALWRRGLTFEAARAFEASVATDSLFGSAIYQRWLMGRAYAGGSFNNDWPPRVRARIALLTQRERAVFDAEDDGENSRTTAQRYAAIRRVAEQLGDAPEAWFLVGDDVFHAGNQLVDPDSVLQFARQFFSLALALDTQPIFLFHMSDLAVNTGDTALMRRLLPVYTNLESADEWLHRWILASTLRDEAALASLRRAGPPKDIGTVIGPDLSAVLASTVPISAFEYVSNASPDARFQRSGFLNRLDVTRGRLAAAVGRPIPGAQILTPPTFSVSGDPMDSLLLARLPTTSLLPDTVLERRRQCLRARLLIERGQSVALDAGSIQLNALCRQALRALEAFKRGTLTDSAIASLDTLATYTTFGRFQGFEHRLLARIYESRGDTARAVRAIKLHPHDYGGPWTAPTEREAGRLFLMAKDTARAIAAYEHFLELRTEAQPPLIAERDSIKALVSRLKTRLTP